MSNNKILIRIIIIVFVIIILSFMFSKVSVGCTIIINMKKRMLILEIWRIEYSRTFYDIHAIYDAIYLNFCEKSLFE